MKNLIKTVTIPKTSGKKLIKDSKLFLYTDSDFVKYGASEKGEPMEEINVGVFELTKDSRFSDFLSKDNLITQEQIINYCENHKDLLTNWYTFFPFKSGDEVFVACVYVYSGGLFVNVVRFSFDHVWSAAFRPRFVVPQLKTSELSDLSLRNSDSLTLKKAIEICKENGLTVTKTY